MAAPVKDAAAGRLKRASPAQMFKLLEYVNLHPEMVRMKGYHSTIDMWGRLAIELNQMGPPKTGDGWKRVWIELKCRIRKKLNAKGAAKPLTDIEKRMIEIESTLNSDSDEEEAHAEHIIEEGASPVHISVNCSPQSYSSVMFSAGSQLTRCIEDRITSSAVLTEDEESEFERTNKVNFTVGEGHMNALLVATQSISKDVASLKDVLMGFTEEIRGLKEGLKIATTALTTVAAALKKPQKRKKLSGAQFRRQKREREELKKKLAVKFSSQSEDKETECQEKAHAASTSTALNPGAMEVCEVSTCASPSNSNGIKTEPATEVPVGNLDCEDDPGLWPVRTNTDLVNILVRRGPVQVFNYNFPGNDNGRKFSDRYYYRQLPYGEKICREWLVYSISNDAVYCFCCKIFGKTESSLSAGNGFSDWQHLTITLKRHETSLSHIDNEKSWLQLRSLVSKTDSNDFFRN